ncbi:FkbM family methyltransferase [Pararhizobium sp.]|uniref:FkbM family methyltransferase n=1 Tax=Pararhizobium sp. TaxID=1977563 RepID=UPI0027179B32|nr:FkbM family methyltransferase [Pararhizobium sp.]MDO9418743.1 FkbM family methyltransferase [Pararhizobium sp.]
MTLKYAFRDFFRRRRLARHTAEHGDTYSYHGCTVTVPERAGVGVRHALLRNRYEADEAAMISSHLPHGMPVIELGGSLGVVSALVRSRIGRTARHVVVEANPDLIDICTANAAHAAETGATEVVNAAVFYDAPFARFRITANVHENALDTGDGPGRLVEVPAITLATLYERLGSPETFALVSDIEGAEYAVFAAEVDILAKVSVAVIEVHPDEFERQGKSLASFLVLGEAAGLKLAASQADVVVLKR